jgi:glutamyl-tRNA synthetase
VIILSFTDEIREIIRKHSLINATSHEGEANVGVVLGRVLGERAELRKKAKELKEFVSTIVFEINQLTIEEQMSLLTEKWPDSIQVTKKKQQKTLPPLKNVKNFKKIVTRFSPNPDCALHLGSVRAIVLSHDYAKMYNGDFILRFEDTDPRLKKSSLEFYDMIRDDLRWLKCEWNSEYIQSDRIQIYYEHARKLLEIDGAYVCTCKPEKFREKIFAKKNCECRTLSTIDNLSRWDKMLDSGYQEGEAVVRIKTEIDHPNPAIRDWPALRIIDMKKTPHPRTGEKYSVWPLYNFSAGIDDHLLGITHIIRGKEHLTNTDRQLYLYKHLSWTYPETIHYGRLKVEGTTLSKSKIMIMINEKTVDGLDDPRLATLVALRRRGITPDALRTIAYEVGPRPVDATLSWENIFAVNRKIIDPTSNRYFFIDDPIELIIKGVNEPQIANPLLNPNDKSKGFRTLKIIPKNNSVKLLISKKDHEICTKGHTRLIGLFNIEYTSSDEKTVYTKFYSKDHNEARKLNTPLIHWLPLEGNIKSEIIMPDAKRLSGLVEPMFDEKTNNTIQLVRFGFVRIDHIEDEFVRFYYSHG